jgi:hypothetical protein
MKSSLSLLAAVASLTALSLAAPAEAQSFYRGHAAQAPAVAARPAYFRPSFAPPVPAPRPFFRRRGPVVIVVPAPAQPAPVVAPPPADEHGVLVLGTTCLTEGQAVRVEWGAGYHNAQVIRVHADGTVLVHYTGWSAMWDESVPRYRLRLPR